MGDLMVENLQIFYPLLDAKNKTGKKEENGFPLCLKSVKINSINLSSSRPQNIKRGRCFISFEKLNQGEKNAPL